MRKVKPCPICNSKISEVFLKERRFVLKKCKECRLISTILLKSDPKKTSKIYLDRKILERQICEQAIIYDSYAKIIFDFVNPSKDTVALDVGCGLGWLVKKFSDHNIHTIGIDESEIIRSVAKEKLGINIIAKSFEKFESRTKFNLIILNHVLEHVKDPNQFLQKCKKLLKKGGKILIVCPNINSFMFKIFKEKWYGLVVDQHLWQFSPEHLIKILERNGFEIQKYQNLSMYYNPPGVKGLAIKLLAFLSNKLNYGDQSLVLAKYE